MSEAEHTQTDHTGGNWGISKLVDDSIWIDNGCVYIAQMLTANPDTKHNAPLVAASPAMLDALRRAERFITNGIELGYITMPDPETNDPASDTLPAIRDAIRKATTPADGA